MPETSTLIAYDGKISREKLTHVPTRPATPTHQTIPHHHRLSKRWCLSFRQIGVVEKEYTVSKDG